MPYGFKRGMGVTTYECEAIQNSMDPMSAHVSLPCMWAAIFGYSNSEIGTPPGPTGSALTVPPASGEDAAALAQSLADQQLAAQKAIDAAAVKSTWLDQLSSGIVDDVINPLTNPGGLSWMVWGALGLAVFGLVVYSGGSARRYGR